MVRYIGIDPGLQRTGWGIVEYINGTLRLIAADVISSNSSLPLATRLLHIRQSLAAILAEYSPHHAAIEETFVNNNYRSSLLLAQARGVALVTLAEANLAVAEYSANTIKKSIVGRGHADKQQMLQMVKYLIPGTNVEQLDTADAIAIAICHAHHVGK